MTNVVINDLAVRRLMTDSNGPVVRFLASTAERVLTQAKINFASHTDTGRGINSLTWFLTGEPSARVGSDVDYMLWVHEGTQPHTITATPGKVLSWVGPGGRMFAHSVNHPGYSGDPYLRRALNTVMATL